MIISSEIENVEKVENFIKTGGKIEKSILRAFARTRAKKKIIPQTTFVPTFWPHIISELGGV